MWNLLAFTLPMGLAGCVALSPHRTQFGDSACDPSIVVAGCDDNAWVRSGNAYDLFFVEFDDQGLLYPKEPKEQFGNASNQIELTLEKLRTLAAAGQSLSLVVYVHGWKMTRRRKTATSGSFTEC